MRRLTDEAQADRDEFEYVYDGVGCSCHLCAPCGACCHPGNPINQEDDSCWIEEPDEPEIDVMDVTRRMFR